MKLNLPPIYYARIKRDIAYDKTMWRAIVVRMERTPGRPGTAKIYYEGPPVFSKRSEAYAAAHAVIKLIRQEGL